MSIRRHSLSGNPTSLCGPISRCWTTQCSGMKQFSSHGVCVFPSDTVALFRSKEERDTLLRGTGIPEAVDADLANIQKEYTDVVLPFITRHPDLWTPDIHTLELYTKLVAFVMAYRFSTQQIPLFTSISTFAPPHHKLPFLHPL